MEMVKKKKQTELLKLKSTIYEIKTLQEGIKGS